MPMTSDELCVRRDFLEFVGVKVVSFSLPFLAFGSLSLFSPLDSDVYAGME